MKRILKAARLAKYAKLEDAECISLYRQGELPAIVEIIYRYHDDMLLYAAAIVGPWLADDVMQDTWEALLNGLQDGSYKEKQLFNRYIRSIVKKRAIAIWIEEHRMGMNMEDEPEPEDEGMNAEEMLLKKESRTLLGRLLKKAGGYAAKVFILRFTKRKTFKEIARIMHVSKEITLRVLYFRTLREICTVLAL